MTTVIDFINVLNFLATVAAVAAVVFAYIALKAQRVATAWSLIAAAKVEGTGNIGLIDALQGLAKRGARFEQIRLPGAHLSKLKLPDAHLEGAVLTRANLSDANLTSATLAGADLRKADLRRIDLHNSNLRGAILDESNLSGANLQDADLRGASLIKAHLFRADLRGARLELANFSGADLSATRLQLAKLDGSRLDNAIMRGTDLSDTNLRRAILLKTDLRRANLTGAYFGDALVTDDVIFDNACGDARNASLPAWVTLTIDKKWCGPPLEAQETPFPGADMQRTVYYLIPTLIDEWETESQKAIERLFAELHYEVISIDAREDAERQNNQLAKIVKLRPPIIILNAVDGDKIDRRSIERARHAGIRILVYDRPISVEADFTSVTDPAGTGQEAARITIELLRSMSENKIEGKILQILGDPLDNWSRGVQIDFERELSKKAPHVQVISKPAMQWDPDNARKIAREQLGDKDIKIVYAHAADLADAVVDILKDQRKKPGDIKIISSNGAPVGLKNISEGWQEVEIDLPVYAQVYGLALFLDEIMKGGGKNLAEPTREVLGVHGTLRQDKLRGPIFTLSGKVITKKNVGCAQFWGNLVPPKQTLPPPCQPLAR
jgi:ribose transport system substrate-binding protein